MLKKKLGRVKLHDFSYSFGAMMKKILFTVMILLAVVSCAKKSQAIVSNVEERDANIIIVFLESKGIYATKEMAAAAGAIGGAPTIPKYNIYVEGSQAVRAMSILNSNGLPRKQGTNLLELFAAQGLMTTSTEETIRYQAGLTSQVTNMILMIDGVIDANVQISFPESTTTGPTVTSAPTKLTASVYVKHQGIMDDPNAHLEMKIKRLVAGSIQGLDINDVTVVSDRSRYTDITVNGMGEKIGGRPEEYVRIWGMVLSKGSAHTFRSIFILLLLIAILLAILVGWMIWKFYPVIRTNGGLNQLFKPLPFLKKRQEETPPPEETR